jgi:hypothetical protein
LYDGSLRELCATIGRAISERTVLPKIGGELLEMARSFDWKSTALVTYKDYLGLRKQYGNVSS